MSNCPICRRDGAEELYDMGGFTLLCCPACRLVFQRGAEGAAAERMIGEIYDEKWVRLKETLAETDLYNHFGFYSSVVQRWCPPSGRLLEIGCGTAEFLYLMGQTGRKVRGVEPSAVSCAYGRERYGLDVACAMWSGALLGPEERYDAVVFWHVLEHARKPEEFLRQAADALRDGGALVFCVPNNECFVNLALRGHSPLYAERDHLYHYAASNLPLLLERAGLRAAELFAWEPPRRLESDWELYRSLLPARAREGVKDQLSFFASLLAEGRGYELFCVARPR